MHKAKDMHRKLVKTLTVSAPTSEMQTLASANDHTTPSQVSTSTATQTHPSSPLHLPSLPKDTRTNSPTESVLSCASAANSVVSFASITNPAPLIPTVQPGADCVLQEPLTTTHTGRQVRHKVLSPRDSSCYPNILPSNEIDNAIPTCKPKPTNNKKKIICQLPQPKTRAQKT